MKTDKQTDGYADRNVISCTSEASWNGGGGGIQRQMDRYKWTHTHTQQGESISINLFLPIKYDRLKMVKYRVQKTKDDLRIKLTNTEWEAHN
jgi:hypothetical protein